MISGYQKALDACTSGIIADELTGNVPAEDDAAAEEEEEDSRASPVTITTTATIENSRGNRDMDLEVSAVLDVLPDLGMGFIRRVLTRYENSEQAISAILDDNLPPDLVHMDRQEIYIPSDPQDKLQRQTGVRHYNVHDGDKYDVLTRDNPECIIKQGKGLPGAPRNAEQLLDDKREIKQLKERYQQYTLVEETPHEDGGEYDDEYDDSYEALNDGQAPPQSLLRARLQQASAAAASSAYEAQDTLDDDEDQPSSDEEQRNPNAAAGKRNDFCENPEVIRARYQQRQQAKYGSGGGGGQRPQQDVVGAPKGQGQSQQTTRNRGQKEAHKSSRANHNRKAGAAFKRSKGMMS